METVRRFAGYDPGGDGAHGVANLLIDSSGRVIRAEDQTVDTADAAVAFMRGGKEAQPLSGVGVDTLTEWCLGPSGWRSADAWLRRTYPTVKLSVASPNSLFGAMGLNGMAAVVTLRAVDPLLIVSETHPKVLYFALSKRQYAWKTSAKRMIAWLSGLMGTPLSPTSEHAFDALLSAWACTQGVLARWQRDLHQPIAGTPAPGSVIRLAGITNYFWP